VKASAQAVGNGGYSLLIAKLTVIVGTTGTGMVAVLSRAESCKGAFVNQDDAYATAVASR